MGNDEWKNVPYVFQAMMQEICGTFIFVLLFKIVTDERLQFSKENAINCFIIASSYVAARQIVNGTSNAEIVLTFGDWPYITFETFKGGSISTYGACMNPAIAVGITLCSIMEHAGETMKWFWIYWLMPFA